MVGEALTLDTLSLCVGKKVWVKLADENDPCGWVNDLKIDCRKKEPWLLMESGGSFTACRVQPPGNSPWRFRVDQIRDGKILIYPVISLDISNKGKTKCWKCSCPTEKRRNFNTFTVEDMCPRCKI